MIVFDEGALIGALHETAESFEITEGATDQILAQALLAGGVAGGSRIQLFLRHYGRGRTSLRFAAAVVVILAMSVPLLRHEGTPAANSAISKLAPGSAGLVANGSNVLPTQGLTPTKFGYFAPSRSPVNTQGTAVTVTGSGFDLSSVRSSASASTSSLRVEKVGSMTLQARDLSFQSDVSKLTALAALDGGFVGSSHIHTGTKSSKSFSSGTIVLQVPQGNFNKLVTQVSRVGDATSIVTSASDVTGQYVDLTARITALEVSRQQYLKIMTRTSSISGILSVQSQLNALQSQIEEMQALLGLLNTETTYGSLTVSLIEPGHTATSSGIERAWHDSVGGFVAGLEWLIRLGGPLLFSVLLLAGVLYLGRIMWRVVKRRRI